MQLNIKPGGAILAVILLVATVMFWPQLKAGTETTDWQKQWLMAEGEPNMSSAIKLWEALYDDIKDDENVVIAPGVSGADVRRQLFSAYLKHAEISQSSPLLNKASKLLDDTSTVERAWGYVLIATTGAQVDKRIALAHLRKLDKLIPQIESLHERSHLAHGLVMAALAEHEDAVVHHWDGTELAEKWIPFISTTPHLAQALHVFARYDQREKTAIGHELDKLLQIPLDKGRAREKQLLALHVKALEQDQFYVALDALSGIADGNHQQKSLYTLYKSQWEAEEYSRAEAIAQRLSDGKNAARAWGKLAKHFADIGQTERAKKAGRHSVETANATSKLQPRTEALLVAAEYLAGSGDIESASNILKTIEESDNPKPYAVALDKVRYAMAKAFALNKQFDEASSKSDEITDKELRSKAEQFIEKRQMPPEEDKALDGAAAAALEKKYLSLSGKSRDDAIRRLALYFTENGEKKKAAYLAREMSDAMARTRLFRQMAEMMAYQMDAYQHLSKNESQLLKPTKFTPEADSESKIIQWENSIKLGTEPNIRIEEAPDSALGKELPDFMFPERLKYNVAHVRTMLPETSPFTAARSYYQNNFFVNTKFKLAIDQSDANFSEKISTPEIIYLASGTATLPQLYDRLRASGMGKFLTRQKGAYSLRRPLVVGPNANLIIDGSEVKALYMVRDHSVIIINAGNLFIIDSKLIGWDEKAQKIPRVTYKDRYRFRPFIASFSNSHTYVAGNELVALGYNNHKSYGLSYSEGPGKLVGGTIYTGERPDGIVADNSFDNAFYGFYSYEADNVTMVGNEYKQNIVYGIDPHDRSRWLTIAFNTAYGTEKKHGIIVSREVNDSSYVGNLSFDNHGSGLMIDRLSTGTYVYGNTAFDNDQDGLTLFESSCNLVASNHFFHNKSMGIRVRNSQDNGLFYNHLNENIQGGVYAYTSELLDDPAHVKRNFAMDPYADVAAASMIGNYIADNGFGVMVDNMSALLLRENQFVNQAPKILQGTWLAKHPHIASQYDISKGVLIDEACPSGKWIARKCRFREGNAYLGDGQQQLEQRVTQSTCQKPSRQDQL